MPKKLFDLLNSFPLTSKSYHERLNILHERFGDPGRIKANLYNEIINLKPQNSTVTELRRVFDKITVSLTRLRIENNTADLNLLFHVIRNKRKPYNI